MKKILTLILFQALIISSAFAADIRSLDKLFKENFDNFYQPRYCGRNTARFVAEAQKRKINLSNSYVLKIVGGGFWETSGFYTRNNINERVMLGYFHMVFVADGYVFDFDLDDPIIVKLDEYFKLQFTPPAPYSFYGGEERTISELKNWSLTAFDYRDYSNNSKETVLWQKKLGELINVKRMIEKPRVR